MAQARISMLSILPCLRFSPRFSPRWKSDALARPTWTFQFLVLGAPKSALRKQHSKPLKPFSRARSTPVSTSSTPQNVITASEEFIGQAVSHRRKDFYLFTKCGHPHGSESAPTGRRDSILQSIERSLKRLRTDCVDIVQLHSCSEAELSKGEAIAALQTAREQGHTRYIGYSGDSHAAQLRGGDAALSIRCRLPSTSPTRKQSTSLFLLHAKKNGRDREATVANAAWKTGHKPIDSYSHEYWERLRKLTYHFLHIWNLEQSVALALRFTLSVPGVHTAIVGTSKPERWQENARMLQAGPLSPEAI